MGRVEKTSFSKKFIIRTKDPVSLAASLFETVSSYGNVERNKNIYETDGPRKRLNMEFELLEKIDNKSSVRLVFSLLGEWNGYGFLEIGMKSVSTTEREPGGVFTETFSEFYMNELLPRSLGTAEKKIEGIAEDIEKKLRKEHPDEF